MTEQNKKIINEVNQEINNQEFAKLKEEVKKYKLEMLNKQEELKEQKEKIEEQLRIVKLNLDNLEKGNFDAIKERIEKSNVAKMVTPIFPEYFKTMNICNSSNWNSFISGTFKLNNGKIFYF
jgi:hypothetical protein